MTEPITTETSEDPPAYQEVRSELPAHECRYCARVFAREEWRTLHHGLAHPGSLDDEEIEAFRDAHAAEEDELRRFRLKALMTLILVYFGLLMVYAVV